ncbi:MAG: anaerobic ribonucleoside-triphosphate reductase activating protein, partial [Candidatus Omnitrophica bacterium]|nr:anaerobic ribonucleoside-triphosphate reductase activating protein [Candidatus Omnitrophota bacterium]
MLIAGTQKLSLVDYPGHLAAVIFTAGCNFRCGYCHNPGLVLFDGRETIATEDFLSELSRRRNMIEGVVISGGEPTLFPDLPEFAESLKEMGFLVKLDTNGSDPDMVFRMLRDRVIDYVAMDVKTSLSRYEEVTGVKGIAPLIEESIRWIMLSCVPYEFRTTCVPG